MILTIPCIWSAKKDLSWPQQNIVHKHIISKTSFPDVGSTEFKFNMAVATTPPPRPTFIINQLWEDLGPKLATKVMGKGKHTHL